MGKRTLSVISVIIVILLGANLVYAQIPVTAKLHEIQVEIDGKTIRLYAYNIDGYNFFRIRDICQGLDYSVEWDNDSDEWGGNLDAFHLDTGEFYLFNAEYASEGPDNTKYSAEQSSIYLQKLKLSVNAYEGTVSGCNIDGYNYYKLRDLADVIYNSTAFEHAADKPYITVEWQAEQQMIVIKSYYRDNVK